MKKCPYCAEEIQTEAIKCKHCGEWLNEDSKNDDLNFWDEDENENDNEDANENEDLIFLDNVGEEKEVATVYDYQPMIPKKESITKKILNGIGMGSLVIGGGFLSISFIILRFLFTAAVGLSTIGIAISLFRNGSIVWGLVVLFIGTPVVIGLANYLFIFFFLFSILTLVIWGIIKLFGFDVTFNNVWDGIWGVMKLLFTGGLILYLGYMFIDAIKNKNVTTFIEENWGYAVLLIFFFWIFFK